MNDIITIEMIDKFINDFILDDTIELPEEAQFFYFFHLLSERLKERKLLPLNYKSTYFKNYSCYALEFTGEPLQEEVIKKWLAPRKCYFCEGQEGEPFFFCPGPIVSTYAKKSDYIMCGNNFKDLTVLSKEGFEKDFVYEG